MLPVDDRVLWARAQTAALRGTPAEVHRLALIDAAAETGNTCAVCGLLLAPGVLVVSVSHRAPWFKVTGEVVTVRYSVASTCRDCFARAETDGWPLALVGRGEPVTIVCVTCARPMLTRTRAAAPVCSRACLRAYERRRPKKQGPEPGLRTCVERGKTFAGQRSARTCSPRCRQRLHRRRPDSRLSER